MKRLDKLLILVGVLVVLCVGTVIVLNTEEKKEQIKNTDEVILALPADTVTELSWEYGDTSVAFRKDGAWKWEADEAFPADEEKITRLLSVFESFGAAFVIEDVEDFGQYGMDDPTCTIRLTADGKTYEVILGVFSAMDSQRYVSIGDGNVYLVRTDPFDSFEVTAEDLIRNDETPSFDTVTALRFSGAESYAITRDEESAAGDCDSDVYYTTLRGSDVPLDTFRVEDYCGTISLLDLTDFVSYNVSDDELTAWGLKEPELTLTVEYTVKGEDDTETGERFVLSIGRNQEELSAKTAAEAEGKNYTGSVTAYARVGDSSIVYKISQSDYNALRAAAYNDLRHREVLTAGFDCVTAVSVTLEDKTYALTSAVPEDDKDGETVWSFDGEEIDISALQTKVTALSVDEFTEETPADKEEISLTFAQNKENHPETSVKLYRYDGTDCLAVINGQSVGLVSRADVVALIEAVNAIVLG